MYVYTRSLGIIRPKGNFQKLGWGMVWGRVGECVLPTPDYVFLIIIICLVIIKNPVSATTWSRVLNIVENDFIDFHEH